MLTTEEAAELWQSQIEALRLPKKKKRRELGIAIEIFRLPPEVEYPFGFCTKVRCRSVIFR